jgi:hypothetical protein
MAVVGRSGKLIQAQNAQRLRLTLPGHEVSPPHTPLPPVILQHPYMYDVKMIANSAYPLSLGRISSLPGHRLAPIAMWSIVVDSNLLENAVQSPL